MTLPDYAKTALYLLERSGFEAFVVGGAVRDMLLGVTADDIDITTNALPHEIMTVFSGHRTIPTGLQHGTVTVLIDNTPIEITTYRKDGDYQDHRHPLSVTFTDSLEEDLARRDFTINAMAYSPTRGIIDPFNGENDLRRNLLRCVGDPFKRFEEDALRIARLLRFMSVLNFSAHEDTFTAAQDLSPLLSTVAAERKRVELCKMLMGDGFLRTVTQLHKPFLQIVPHLKDCYGFLQHNPHHDFDVFEHIMRAVAAAPKDLTVRLALLFHDIGKPHTFSMDENGIGHFYSHAAEGEFLARCAMTDLRFDNHTIHSVLPLILHHGDELRADKKLIRKKLAVFGEDGLRRLIAVKIADACGCKQCTAIPDYSEIVVLIDEILKDNACLRVTDLAINGHDLMALGYHGRQIGVILTSLLEAVINEDCDNTSAALIAFVKERLHHVI